MENSRQPNIRFAEFTSNLEEKKFVDIVNRVSKQSNANNVPKVEFEDIISGEGKLNKDISNKYDDRKGTIFEPNYILYGKLRPYLKNWLLPNFRGVALGDFWVFESKNSSAAYVYYLIQTAKYQIAANLSSGTKMPRSDWKTVSETTFYVPLIEEQNKVGKFFTQLDETISLHQQELDTLKQTKQGFLQKMFPKEGESVPELRFPGFTEDWEASNLIDMTTLITKGTTPKDKYSKGNVNFIKVENIEAYSGAISVTSKVSQEEHERYLKRSQLKCGDILFSIAGTLGRTAVIKEEILPANTNQALAIIRLANGNIDFIETYLKGKAVKDYIRKNPTVGAQPNLSLRQVGELSISYPSDLEQKKIGVFFKNLDRTIALQQQELDALKQTKKAFLQKMFV